MPLLDRMTDAPTDIPDGLQDTIDTIMTDEFGSDVDTLLREIDIYRRVQSIGNQALEAKRLARALKVEANLAKVQANVLHLEEISVMGEMVKWSCVKIARETGSVTRTQAEGLLMERGLKKQEANHYAYQFLIELQKSGILVSLGSHFRLYRPEAN